MRYQGKITKWKDDQGFGFITPNGSGEPVFVHVKAFSNRQRRPVGNEIVTYELACDERGRPRAEDVDFVAGATIGASSGGGTGWIALPVLFLAFVVASVLTGKLPLGVSGLYLAASLIAFLAYERDKSAAKKGQWRIPEGTLHILGLIGGWPGAFVAQKLLRHKTKKASFLFVFWVTVVVNCIGLLWLSSLSGSDALRSIPGASDLP